MSDQSVGLIALTQAGLLLLAGGLGGSLVRRWWGRPALIGAVLAGLLLGPSVLGVLAPQSHRVLFRGGAEAEQKLDAYLAQRRQARRTLKETDVSAPAIEQFDAKTEQRKAELQEQLRAAERPYRRAGRWLSAGVVVLALLAAGLMSPIGGFAGQASAAVPIGLAAALVPGLLMAAAAWALLRTGWTTVTELDPGVWGAGLAAGCAVMAVPLLPGPARRLAPAEADGAADSMGQQLRAAGAVNALAVLTALAVGAFFVRDGQVPSAVQTAAVAAPVALLIGLVMRAGMPERAGRGVERWARPVLLLLFGLAGLRTDLTGGIDWLLIVLVLLGFGDGKSAGLMLGIRMFAHRPWLEALRMGTVSATGGAAPLAVALLLRGAGVIDNPAYVALVAASVLSAWLAEPMLRALDHTVEQMNQPPDDAQ